MGLRIRAGILVGGELARRESRGAARETPAEAGGDTLAVLRLVEQRDNSGLHHHDARVPASSGRNPLELLLV